MTKWLITYQWSCSALGYGDSIRTENELIDIHPVEWLRKMNQSAVNAGEKINEILSSGEKFDSRGHDHGLLNASARTEWQLLWALPVSDEIYENGREAGSLLESSDDDT